MSEVSGVPPVGVSRAPRLRGVLRNPMAVTALVFSTVVLALAVVGPFIWGEAAEQNDFTALDAPASSGHFLGTDKLGRDILTRVLVAARLSIGLALAATAVGLVAGVLLGALASMLRGWPARTLAMLISIGVAFPGLLLALFFAVIFGVGPRGAVLALGMAITPGFARLTQTLSASIAAQDYVAAAEALGVSKPRILVRHVLPNLAEPLVVNATMAAGSCLLAFAGLSYLGLGVQPPAYDWGRMLSEGLNSIYTNPAAALGPAAAIVVSGLAFNFAGEFAAQVVGGRSTVNVRPTRAAAPEPRLSGRATLSAPADESALLRVRNLQVRIAMGDKTIAPVRGVDLDLAPGEAVGVLGESGSGKSLTALTIAQLLSEPIVVEADELTFDGADLRGGGGRAGRRHLGTTMSLVFQDPSASFNPTMRVGDQLAEVGTEHLGMSRSAARGRAVDRLRSVRISAAQRRAAQYPHELSGGMRQRAMIGMGLMGEPRLLIADEPTTALDVTVQQQVLELIEETRRRTGAALLLISHDISVVSAVCDRIVVMYAGRIVEELRTEDLTRARHPYTRALIAALPTMETDRSQQLATIVGRPPDPAHLPVGCPFAPRCPAATAVCEVDPPLHRDERGSYACHHPEGER